jgi:hypothetical protein
MKTHLQSGGSEIRILTSKTDFEQPEARQTLPME